MTTRTTSLLLATTSAAALSIFAFGAVGTVSANAQACLGDNGAAAAGGGWSGGPGATIIDCGAPPGTAGGDVNGNAGDDTITTNDSLLDEVNGNSGDDTITLNGPAVANDINSVSGGTNNDLITLDGADIAGDIDGNAGDDTILLINSVSDVNNVFGSSGADTIELDGAWVGQNVVGGKVFGGTGPDVIKITSGTTDFVGGGANADTITMSGGTIDDDGGADSGNLQGDVGDDLILVTGGTIESNVEGNAGDDTISVVDASVGNDIEGSNGNDVIFVGGTTTVGTNVEGGTDDDAITIDDMADIGNNVEGGGGDDEISLLGGTVGNDILGGTGNDTITLTGGTVVDNVEGNNGNDTITLDGAFLSEDVEGGQGEDVINLNSGTVGNSGFDLVEGGEGDDTITLNGAFIEADILGNEGNDTIKLLGGTVDDEVFGGLDDDLIILDGALVGDDINGDEGNDTISLLSGTVIDNVEGDDGDDTITLDGAFLSEDLEGGKGEDIINLNSGTVGNSGFDLVEGGEDNDTITLNGAFIEADILGNEGDDVIDLLDGTVDDEVFGNSGDDIITLSGAVVGDTIFAGADDDFVELTAGTVGVDVLGGSGNDGIVVFGGFVGGDVNGESGDDAVTMFGGEIGGSLEGGSDNDVVGIFGGVVGGSVDGEGGEDTVTLSGGTIGVAALGGTGSDIGIVTGSFNFDNLGAGTGNFAGDENTDTDDAFDVLRFENWTGEVNADRLPEWNNVFITMGSAATFTGGTFETDGGGDLNVFVSFDSSLLLNDSGGGDLTIAGNLSNSGLVDLSSADTDPDNILMVTGDYTAPGDPDLVLDTFLNDGTPDITDQLFIGGNAGGMTDLTVNPVPGSPGGLTGFGPTDGILVVAAQTSDDDAFSLTNPDLVAGIFEYFLTNPAGQPAGQDNWYLQSDWLDQIYVYENLPGAMQTIGLSLTGQLVERVGVRSAVPSALTDAAGNPVPGGGPVDTALWARAVGLSLESDGDLDSTTGGDFEQTIGFIQGGGEVVVSQSASGRFLIGALGHWGTSSLDANNSRGSEVGSADFDFYGGGLTATWYGTSGLYLDGVVQYTAYDIDISTSTRWPSQSTDGWGVAVSGEAGYRIPISDTAALVPQGQLIWQTLDFDDFTDPDGVRVSYQDDDSLIGRLGVAFENSAAIGSALATGYVEANVMYEFLGDNSVNTFTPVGGTIPINQQTRGGWVELGFGGTIAVNAGVSLYGEIDYSIPFDGGVQGVQALAGVRVNLNPAPPPPPPAPVIAPVAETAFIVFFDWDRADLTPESNLVLDDVVVVANQTGYASIRLDGYTDLSGSAAYNLGLSERRANSVADGLIARGIAPDEIVIRAFGEENPLVPTPDGVREPQNRRVEIFLT